MTTRTLLTLLALAAVAGLGNQLSRADDSDDTPAETTPADTADTAPAEAEGAPVLSFFEDVDAAAAEARASSQPLLIVALPDWYESPEAIRLHKTVLPSATAREGLSQFVRALVTESPDLEVHARHRVKKGAYPLAIVLTPDGTFLGSHSGLSVGEDGLDDDAVAKWVKAIAGIPARHARMEELRKELTNGLESPTVLLELAKLHLEAAEPDRADALLARADPESGNDDAGVLGDVRYLRLTIANDKLVVSRRFTEVAALSAKWLRRFRQHARRPDVRLLQANALYLAGKKDDARALWKAIVKDHEKTPAGERAAAALGKLGS